MKKADAVLIAIPIIYFVILTVFAPLGVRLTSALGVGSAVSALLVAHVLFHDPPT